VYGTCASFRNILSKLLNSASCIYPACSSGDGGPAASARFNTPAGLASAANAPDGRGGWLIVSEVADMSNSTAALR
jgi:hypothetical protein